jgi:hypothetical protein
VFSMACKDQHGLSGESKTRHAARAATSGEPFGGRGRCDGFFLTRCAGLVRCAERKNKQPCRVLAQTGGGRQVGTQSGAGKAGGRQVGEMIDVCAGGSNWQRMRIGERGW